MRRLAFAVGCVVLAACQPRPWAASSLLSSADQTEGRAVSGKIAPQGTVQSYADTVGHVSPPS
jgi:hypothetical protein